MWMPAMTFNSVVLPAPVGPNSTKNSRLFTCKSTSSSAKTRSNRLETPRIHRSPIMIPPEGGLTFDRSKTEAPDQVFLDKQRQKHLRENGNRHRRRHLPVVDGIGGQILQGGHRGRYDVLSRQQQRKGKTVPGKDEGQEGRGDQPRFDQGDEGFQEHPKPGV